MTRLLCAVVTLALAAGASCSLFSTQAACDAVVPCPSGRFCHADGFCYAQPPPATDGGVGRADGGDVDDDAGVEVDGGFDAGFDAGPPPPRWHDQWLFRKQVTIGNPQIAAAVETNVPVWVHVESDAELAHTSQGGGVAHPNGWDIRLGDSGGALYRHELVSWDDATGALDLFVRVPSVALAADTVFFLYYGANIATAPENPWETWSDHLAVYHLDETPGGGATIVDSAASVGAADGVALNMEDADQQPGAVGGALVFDGVDERVDINSARLEHAGAFTIEAWARMDAANGSGGRQRIFQRGYNNLERAVELFVDEASPNFGKVTFRINLGATVAAGDDGAVTHNPENQGADDFAFGQWFHYAVTYNPGQGGVTMDVYIDGQPVTVTSLNGTITDAVLTGSTEYRRALIGSGGANATERPWRGAIDEVRLSQVARSAEYLQLAYTNQSDPGGFLTVGGAQAP